MITQSNSIVACPASLKESRISARSTGTILAMILTLRSFMTIGSSLRSSLSRAGTSTEYTRSTLFTSAACTEIYEVRWMSLTASRVSVRTRTYLGFAHDFAGWPNPNNQNKFLPLRLFVVGVAYPCISIGSLGLVEVFAKLFQSSGSCGGQLQLVRAIRLGPLTPAMRIEFEKKSRKRAPHSQAATSWYPSCPSGRPGTLRQSVTRRAPSSISTQHTFVDLRIGYVGHRNNERERCRASRGREIKSREEWEKTRSSLLSWLQHRQRWRPI